MTGELAPQALDPADRTAVRTASADRPALVVEGLTKRFGDRVAFDDVSFEVGYGEVFGFLGPSSLRKSDN